MLILDINNNIINTDSLAYKYLKQAQDKQAKERDNILINKIKGE